MKKLCLTWLAICLLALPGITLAQVASPLSPLAAGPPVASGDRAVLGGPPRLATEPADTSSLNQLLLQLAKEATAPATTSAARLELSLQVARQLAQHLASTQQQLADLRRELAATRQLAGALLLDHAQLTDLRQQLSLLQSQQAAAFSAAHQFRVLGRSAE